VSALSEWFKDAGHAALVAALVSVGSLVLAVIALVKSSRAQSRVLSIEEEREADRKRHAQKARLVARIVKRSDRDSYWLEIENQGEAEAHSLEYTLDGQAPGAHAALRTGPDKIIRRIGPHSVVRHLLILTMQERPPYDFAVTWRDASDELGEFRTTLTF
jgi:hypothetical protein